MIVLTGQNMNSHDLIQNVFSPMVAAICSDAAEEVCLKNNLTFVEMLQPFSTLTNDAHFRDNATGASVSVRGLHVNVTDIEWRPPQTMLARKMLNESVANAPDVEAQKSVKVTEDLYIDIPDPVPWFEHWRETFFNVQFPSDHEFTRHFIACLIVVSSTDANPLETAQQLTQKVHMMQSVTPPRLPKWFSPQDVLNCYVMVHDGSTGDIGRTQQGFDSLKSTFGENRCFLMPINSSSGPQKEPTDHWKKYIRRHQKNDNHEDIKSPMDPSPSMMSTSFIPPSTAPSSTLSGSSGDMDNLPPPDIVVSHPLSPMNEGQDLLQAMTSSTESIASSLPKSHDSHEEGHGWYLSSIDCDNLRHFIQDFVIRALIPYVERIVGILNEAIANKKGVSRSLLSATKRWFVTNKPTAGMTQNAVVYAPDSTEIQTRKLGDLYFMFCNYNLAFQAYHQAKNDFKADSAWQYYAGALEMAALSAFMQNSATRKTYDYMEEAIITYMSYCKLPQFATRATLLSLECLKNARLYAEACRQLTRMTSEDSDLRSALLLEQAAFCYLQNPSPYFRKYAFHLVLAAHRYQRAGQRKHSYRAHKLALMVYENKSWNLAVDHVLHTVGKQAMTLKKMDEASTLFAHLLRPSAWKDAEKQTMFFMDYISAQKAYQNQNSLVDLVDVAIPVIVQNSVKVLVTSQPPVSNPLFVPASNISINSSQSDETKWNKLEEMVVNFAATKPIMIFKPVRSLFSNEVPALENPLCVHGEPIEISLVLENPIKPKIYFEEMTLLWEFTDSEETTFSNFKNKSQNLDSVVIQRPVSPLEFQEYEKKQVIIKITPKKIGTLRVLGLSGKLSCPNESGTFFLLGKLMFETQWVKTDKKLEVDKRLEITVLPPAPVLHVSFSQIPDEVLAGEIIPVMVNLTNVGTTAINDVYVAVENPRWVSVNPEESELPLSVLKDYRKLNNETFSKDKEARKQYCFKLFKPNEASTVNPKETKTTSIWLQAPYKKGRKEIRFLIYYAMSNDYPRLKYRLVRHIWNLNVHESLNVMASCTIGDANETGIDVNIKNLNQVHHALMTNIHVSNVSLFCEKYKLSDRLNFLQSPAYQRIFQNNDELGLKSDESIGIRLPLVERPMKSYANFVEFLRAKLSEIIVKNMREVKHQLPELDTPGSFLMKNETKFVDVYRGTSAEEFSSIISKVDAHMTLCISWKALVNDGSTTQRNTFGQHFVQLRNLFELFYCPPRERLQRMDDCIGIYETLPGPPEHTEEESDAAGGWAPHNVNVAQRCFIDSEVCFLDAVTGEKVKAF